MEKNIINSVYWYSQCPNCNHVIQFKLISKLTMEELQLWYEENQIEVFNDLDFYFEDTKIVDKKSYFIINQIISDMCYHCHRKIVPYVTTQSKLSVRNFVSKLFHSYMSFRQVSLWKLFQDHPQFDDYIEDLKIFIKNSNLFVIGDMYNDGRMQWFAVKETSPYSYTIYAIFDWMIQTYRKYFEERMEEITYNPEYVVKKVKNGDPMNFIDLHHPDIKLHHNFFESELEDVENESKKSLFEKSKPIEVNSESGKFIL